MLQTPNRPYNRERRNRKESMNMIAQPRLHQTRSERQRTADPMTLTFDRWLDTQEGGDWLDEEAEKDNFIRNGYHAMESWDFLAIGA